jgi:molecular chaperone DnaK
MSLFRDLQEIVDEIKKAVEALRTAMASENADDIRSKIDELQKSVMKIGTELSKKGGAGGATEGTTPEPEVKEAEFEEPKKDDDKK